MVLIWLDAVKLFFLTIEIILSSCTPVVLSGFSGLLGAADLITAFILLKNVVSAIPNYFIIAFIYLAFST